MTAIPAEKLDKLVERWCTIQSELSRGLDQASYVQLSKEFAELSPLVATIQALRKAEAERTDLTAPRREGLWWIEVSDPRLRKADKLKTTR